MNKQDRVVPTVQRAWTRLGDVTQLTFEARSATASSGWNGNGTGIVRVKQADPLTLLFDEEGAWVPVGGKKISFSNVFRLQVDPTWSSIRLEHLRLGPEHPVYLFDLVPVTEQILEPAAPHVCREDRYAAKMLLTRNVLKLQWTIHGPDKNESIEYVYW